MTTLEPSGAADAVGATTDTVPAASATMNVALRTLLFMKNLLGKRWEKLKPR